MWRYLLPLGAFVVLVVFLSIGLKLDPKKIPSPLIGKPAPAFELPDLHNAEKIVSPESMKGQVWVLNVWASWCVSCRAEHPVLNELVRSNDQFKLIGLNYKDTLSDGRYWLQQRGNPYAANAFDKSGRVGIDWGVYGVPETFVIDAEGIVRYKHTGPLSWQSVQKELLPAIKEISQKLSQELSNNKFAGETK
ncbi:MAG: DsbE family thiol:disulfide interchange protein [Gammaproteobacteria bacterium]|nr:DsbE family thiol:disulfide interchange protein [Gammaproteobacteria bacterium]